MSNVVAPPKQSSFALAVVTSLICGIFLIRAVDWAEAWRFFLVGASTYTLITFAAAAVLIVALFAFRYRLIVGPGLSHRDALSASIMTLGGNMFLPLRGGDLVRVHYTHLKVEISHSEAFSYLFIEKIIDLVTLAFLGLLAFGLLERQGQIVYASTIMVLAAITLATAIAGVGILKLAGGSFLIPFRRVLSMSPRTRRLEHYLTLWLWDTKERLTFSAMVRPAVITLIIWLTVYPMSYIFGARIAGVHLSYTEALTVLFAGALGLMLPSAPSGVGTYHASVVSAFMILNRSTAQGLLAATTIHLLFLFAYALPAGIVYSRWQISHQSEI